MREQLKKLDGRRAKFTASFVRYGSKPAGRYPGCVTLLFRDVAGTAGEPITDHLWFRDCMAWRALNLQPGDRVAFEARAASYTKGYERDEMDYKLSHPTHIRKLVAADCTYDQFALNL